MQSNGVAKKKKCIDYLQTRCVSKCCGYQRHASIAYKVLHFLSMQEKRTKKNLVWPVHLISQKLVDSMTNLIDHIWSIDQLAGLSSQLIGGARLWLNSWIDKALSETKTGL